MSSCFIRLKLYTIVIVITMIPRRKHDNNVMIKTTTTMLNWKSIDNNVTSAMT